MVVMPSPSDGRPVKLLAVSPRALKVLRYLAAHNDPVHVANHRGPWNYDAWDCPERDAVQELVALGLATRPYVAPWTLRLTPEGEKAIAEVRATLCPCGSLIVCAICEKCERCCHSCDPDTCWENDERWRLTGEDDALRRTSRPPSVVGPAPTPRWPS
jgi:hypothetical protein